MGVAPIVAAQPKPPAGKKAPDAKPPAKDPKAPAKKPPADDDNTLLIVLVVVGGVVVLGGGGLVVWKLVGSGGGGKGDGRAKEQLVAQRKHDWELRMTDVQEAALLRGIQAYEDSGHSLYLSHDDALITFYEPTMIVSLHRVTDAFLAAGPAAGADPVGFAKSTFDAFAAAEGPGVLHTRDGWYMPPIDNLDHNGFTDLCFDTLSNPQPYIEGSQGAYADENKGYIHVKLQADGPMNIFCADLGRVLALVHQARQSQPGAPLVNLVRPVLQGMARGEIAGGMWSRGAASPLELDLVCRFIAAGSPRGR